ncbi:MAG: hypothetical protein KDG50_14795 [Chromatiales bacterium]|nr:hypothetical protein [Chromatiales bacterium]
MTQADPKRAVSAQKFSEYAAAERERRENADDDFDPQLYDAAVELVLNKLGGLEGEGVL